MTKSNILRSEWTCDRCGDTGESNNVVIADTAGKVLDVSIGEQLQQTRMPIGWAHFTYDWTVGALLSQDLCPTCAGEIDAVATRRPEVVDDTPDLEAPKRARKAVAAKRAAAKKTSKKPSPRADRVCMLPNCGCDGAAHE